MTAARPLVAVNPQGEIPTPHGQVAPHAASARINAAAPATVEVGTAEATSPDVLPDGVAGKATTQPALGPGKAGSSLSRASATGELTHLVVAVGGTRAVRIAGATKAVGAKNVPIRVAALDLIDLVATRALAAGMGDETTSGVLVTPAPGVLALTTAALTTTEARATLLRAARHATQVDRPVAVDSTGTLAGADPKGRAETAGPTTGARNGVSAMVALRVQIGPTATGSAPRTLVAMVVDLSVRVAHRPMTVPRAGGQGVTATVTAGTPVVGNVATAVALLRAPAKGVGKTVMARAPAPTRSGAETMPLTARADHVPRTGASAGKVIATRGARAGLVHGRTTAVSGAAAKTVEVRPLPVVAMPMVPVLGQIVVMTGAGTGHSLADPLVGMGARATTAMVAPVARDAMIDVAKVHATKNVFVGHPRYPNHPLMRTSLALRCRRWSNASCGR